MMSAPKSYSEPIFDQNAKSSFSPITLFSAGLARWRSAIALALVCGALLAAAVFAAFPAEYTASAVLKFRFNDFLVATENPTGTNSKDELENQQRTQLAFIKSHQVFDAASKSDPRVLSASKLAKDFKANFTEGTPIMSVSLSGLDPESLAISVEAVTKEFIRLSGSAEQRELSDKADELDKAIRVSGTSIMSKKTALKNMAVSRGDDARTKAIEAEILSNSIELTRTELEIVKRQGSLERARDKLKSLETQTVERAAIEDKLEQLPAVAEALTALAKLETAEADVRGRFTSQTDTPAVMKAAENTRRQRELVQKLKTDLIPKAEAAFRRQLRSELTASIAKDEEELAGLKLAEERLKVNKAKTSANNSSGLPPEIEMKFKEIEQDEDVLKSMRNRRERLRIEMRSDIPKSVLIQSPETPTVPNFRSQYIKTGIAGLSGLLLGWLAIGFLETRSRRVRDGRALTASTGLRILGAIPSGIPSGEGLLRPADLGVAVAADLLRTSLQLDERLRARRTLVITSATEGEGKSTLAMLVAGSFARAGFRTLLVDADLRNPTLTDRLGVVPRPGLSESLTLTMGQRIRSKGETAEDIGEIEEIEGLPLGLIQAGSNGQSAALCLARADLRAWFASLRKNWEYIIVDTPPLLPVPDASFLAKAADGVVLCARAGVSRVEQVHAAVEHIGGLGIDCLGIVLNDVRNSRPNYYGSGRIEQTELSVPSLVAPGSNQ